MSIVFEVVVSGQNKTTSNQVLASPIPDEWCIFCSLKIEMHKVNADDWL